MRSTVRTVIGGFLFLVILSGIIAIQSEEANAIPAFARKYKMTCTTCHAPFPRIKDYGDEFAGNGFVLKDQEATRYFVETGDENLDLIRDLPVAVRLEGFIKHHNDNEKNLDFTTPYNVKLLSGGSITKDIAYYFYFFFSERGKVAGLEDAFIMFNDLFDSELDIYVGQFQVSDPLFKRELRLSYEDYQIYKAAPGESNINLTYDRGVMLTYGFESGTDVIVEVVNGNGLVHADQYRTFDNDKYKNFVGRISQDLPEYFRVGAFGYYGKEKQFGDNTNSVWFLAPDVTFTPNEKFEINFQYVERRDDNPNFFMIKPDDKVETRGGFLEVLYMPEGERSKWYGLGLYNKVDSDLNSSDYETITFHAGYVFKTNLRFIVENTYNIEDEYNRFMVGFISAF